MLLSKANKILNRKFNSNNFNLFSWCCGISHEASDSASFGFKQVKIEEKQEKGNQKLISNIAYFKKEIIFSNKKLFK